MKKGLFITTALAMVLGIGAAVGAHQVKHQEAKVEVAKAEHAVPIGNSGKIYLQLNTAEWQSSGSQIGLYMFNNTVSKSAWGSLVTPSGSSRFVEYSYSLDFTPLQCIAFRFDPGVKEMGSWCFENNRGNSAIWATTNDTDFNHVVWLGNYYPASKWTESGAYNLSAVVKGGDSDSWSVPTVNTQLTTVKVNGSDNLEVYGSVTLPAGTYFKLVKGGDSQSIWVGTYTAHSSIQSNLSGGGANNIHNTAAATYEFYFDYDGETIYITDPAMAAADEWAQYFLANVGCDASGVNEPTGWGACATEYGKLSGDAKDIVYKSEADEGGNYVEQALARYEHAFKSHPSLTKFIKDSKDQIRPVSAIVLNSITETPESDDMIVIIAIVALSSVAFAALLILKKKRHI